MERPSTLSVSETNERIALRTLAQRRRRVIRGVVLFLLVTFALLILSIITRDQQALESCRERVEYAAREFQKVRDQRRTPPSTLPLPEGAPREHYIYNWFFTESFRPEVGVACCRQPHALFWAPPCRMVIILNLSQGKYRAVRMTEQEFAERAEELGLPSGF